MSTLIAATTAEAASETFEVAPDAPVSLCLMPPPGALDFLCASGEAVIVRVSGDSQCAVGTMRLHPIEQRAAVIVGAGLYKVVKRESAGAIGVATA